MDVGFSTVVCKKDTAEVLKNTIEKWLTIDLTLLNNSRVFIGINDDGCVQCLLQNKNNAYCLAQNQFSIKTIGWFLACDIKWMCMLLGMEDMASHLCIYCQLSTKEWKHFDHNRGEAHTIEYIKRIIETNNINNKTKSNPKYQGVKGTPFWPCIPISHYCLSLLHIWMGMFNDIDLWFVRSVGDIVATLPEEQEIKNR
jgi:hypothetical protein